MQIDPKAQVELGSANLIQTGDTYYVIGHGWVIVIPGFPYHLSPEIIERTNQGFQGIHAEQELSNRNRGCVSLDWRIWTAEFFDPAALMFTPYKARKATGFYSSIDSYREVNDVSKVQSELDQYLIFMAHMEKMGGIVDLSKMFREGRAQTTYKKKEEGKEKLKRTPSAETHTFTFCDRVGIQRILSVDADKWHALSEMGFTCLAPTECMVGLKVPAIALHIPGTDPTIYGFLVPSTPNYNVYSQQEYKGRKIFLGPEYLCWRQVEQGETLLCAIESYVMSLRTEFPSVTRAADDDSKSNPTRHLAKLLEGMSILRWNLWTDEQIDNLWLSKRPQALYDHMQVLMNGLCTERLANPLPDWQKGYLKEQVATIRSIMHELNIRADVQTLRHVEQLVEAG